MKRTLSLILAAVLALSLCACSKKPAAFDAFRPSSSSSGTEKVETTEDTKTEPSKIEVSSKNAPSEDKIMEDLKEALRSKNEHATLTGVETVKSLTEDSAFTITVAVTAETKYADWTYEANMNYTKYDQGWMLDNTNWTTADYIVMRVPENEEMTAYVSSFFASSDDEWLNKYADISHGTIYADNVDSSNQITFSWINQKKLMHGELAETYTSIWDYTPKTDSWILASDPEDDDETSIHMQQRMVTSRVDFSGQWSGLSISNYTGEEFDLLWNGENIHFTKTSRYSDNKSNALWYVHESEDSTPLTVSFIFDKTRTTITVLRMSSQSVAGLASAIVEEDLPLLS